MVTGTGVALDDNWDIKLDASSGDVAIEKGSKELQKDLALTLARAYDGSVGGIIDQELIADLELQTERLVQSDPRVDRVDTVDVNYDYNEQVLRVDVQAVSQSYFTADTENDLIEISFEQTVR